jgi:catalase (peroxidase I)
MPRDGRTRRPWPSHRRRSHDEQRLVAEPVEPQNPSSKLAEGKPDGRGFDYAKEFKKLDLAALKKDLERVS